MRRRFERLLFASVAIITAVGAIRGVRAFAECDVESGRCALCGCDHCVVVPDVKTTRKWVYATKLVPYCRTKCPNPLKCRHDACEVCPSCEECVRYKRVLIKREVVTTKDGYKCIPACEACRAKGLVRPERPLPRPESSPVAQPETPIDLMPAAPSPTPADSASRTELRFPSGR